MFLKNAHGRIDDRLVSIGNGTPQVLEYLRPWVDLYKVDLKSFDDRHYRQLGGRLQPILDTVRQLQEMGFWMEIVTLVMPEFNDSDDELTRLAEFLAGVSLDIPWHVTAFHRDYKMTDPENTSAETLMRAAEIGKKAGLRYVYAGNLPGKVGDLENTSCPNCKTLLIERFGYLILGYHLTPNGCCPSCGRSIPGKWASAFQGQIIAHPFVPGTRTYQIACAELLASHVISWLSWRGHGALSAWNVLHNVACQLLQFIHCCRCSKKWSHLSTGYCPC